MKCVYCNGVFEDYDKLEYFDDRLYHVGCFEAYVQTKGDTP